MMTEKEIVRAYRSAQDLRQAVIDLAVRAKTTPDAIRDILHILHRNGYAPPEITPRPVVPCPGVAVDLPRTARLIELVEQGATAEEIAGEMGVSYGQALTWVARLCTLCEEYIAAAEGGGPA